MLNIDKLEILEKDNTLSKVIVLDEIESSNDTAKEYCEEKELSSVLVTCEKQTKGKGRLGRIWESPYGTGIYMSILVRPNERIDKISGITLLAALAIARGIKDIAGVDTGIKWPNDVIVNGKKICGILTEMVTDGLRNSVICGIGINVNIPAFPLDIAEKATSILLETGKLQNREDIIVSVTRYFMKYYNEFMQKGTLDFMLPEYNEILVNRGREVILTAENGTFKDNPYIAKCINSEGELIVTDKNGQDVTVRFGEVSVRGILGYV